MKVSFEWGVWSKGAGHAELMLSLMKNVEDRLDRLEGVKKLAENLEEKIEASVEKKVAEFFEDQQEKEKRKGFIMISNLPESRKPTPDERKQDDLETAKRIVSAVVEVGGEGIENTVRMGKLVAGAKPRTLRVKCNSVEEVDNIMKNVGKLKDTVNQGVTDNKKRVYINRDLPPKERERGKKLCDELRRRRENGEKDLMIRGDKIVQKQGGGAQ
jgi:hypothetical protein